MSSEYSLESNEQEIVTENESNRLQSFSSMKSDKIKKSSTFLPLFLVKQKVQLERNEPVTSVVFFVDLPKRISNDFLVEIRCGWIDVVSDTL